MRKNENRVNDIVKDMTFEEQKKFKKLIKECRERENMLDGLNSIENIEKLKNIFLLATLPMGKEKMQ